MFAGFEEKRISVGDIDVFLRHGGRIGGDPLLMLHGYPQTSAMWHLLAPMLEDRFEVVCPDLRGYGRSSKPAGGGDHTTYSKREMAKDMRGVMAALGHERFYVCGHDRGGRVAHRLGLDHPDAVAAMTIIDIAPTREMYAGTTDTFARAYWHWFLLIQAHPMPEQLIGGDPEAFWLNKCIKLGGGANPFAPEAQAEYLRAWSDPATVHASCEDYRAAATIDIAHDNADNGRKLAMPIDVIWAKGGTVDRCFDPLSLWRQRADDVRGAALSGSHYMVEEIPDQIAPRLRRFFESVPL